MQGEEFFTSRDGQRLFERVWRPEGPSRAAVLIVHGYAEHSGRYAWAAGQLAAHGFGVLGFDLRGHGHSEGERVLIASMNEYLDDVESALSRTVAAFPGVPVFVLGHSMGGSIVTLYACARIPRGGVRDAIRGIVLSGAVLPGPPSLLQSLIGRVAIAAGRAAPRWRMRSLAGEAVSRDPAVVADYDTDPLNYRGKMPAGLLAAIARGLRYIERHAGEVRLPLLVLHGSADSLASPEGSRLLYERAASADKMLKVYEGLYHEILNEPERQIVADDIVAWVEGQLAARGRGPGAGGAPAEGAAASPMGAAAGLQ